MDGMGFLIGDIIKINYNDNSFEYHLVWNIEYEWESEVQEYLDTLVIFPIDKRLDEDEVNLKEKNDIDIVANVYVDSGELLIKNLNKKRFAKGYDAIPTLSDIRYQKKAYIHKSNNPFEDKKVKKTKVKKELKDFPQVQDIIRYDELTSVNECLDAMNDLKVLHNMFGDEAYIQLGELVTKRLGVLSSGNSK